MARNRTSAAQRRATYQSRCGIACIVATLVCLGGFLLLASATAFAPVMLGGAVFVIGGVAAATALAMGHAN